MIIKIHAENQIVITETSNIKYIVRTKLSSFLVLNDDEHTKLFLSDNEYTRLEKLFLMDFETMCDNIEYIRGKK